MQSLSVHLAADTVVDHLAGFLRRASASQIECTVAPYNQVSQVLLAEPHAPVMLLWTSPDLQLPSFARLLSFESVPLAAILEEVAEFAALVKSAAARHDSVFMLSWAFPPERRWPLGLASKPRLGAADVLARLNIHLTDALADVSNVHLIDQSQLRATFPNPIHDPRLYAMARMRYSLDFVRYVAEQLWPVIAATSQPSRKVVICDLDNTLWGGIVGDDGVEGLRIGANDPVGEAHLQLQMELKALNNRGIILAISSKNDLDTALQAIKQHPNMLLKEADFAAKRINWDDKAANIASLLQELNLLPSAAVFLDDNPTERQRVRDAIPEILVPELPSDVAYWAGVVNTLTCFETLNLSSEDLGRAASYRSESIRREAQSLHVNLADWLKSLELVIVVRPLRPADLARATQLLNKTNQFNLHTRRLSESELEDWSSDAKRRCFTFSVADRFGESGLTAVVSAEQTDRAWRIVDFVMSCRVMGKGVEDAIVANVLRQLGGGNGPLRLEATPTAKNAPAQEFAARVAPGGSVPVDFPFPGHVRLYSIDGD